MNTSIRWRRRRPIGIYRLGVGVVRRARMQFEKLFLVFFCVCALCLKVDGAPPRVMGSSWWYMRHIRTGNFIIRCVRLLTIPPSVVGARTVKHTCG